MNNKEYLITKKRDAGSKGVNEGGMRGGEMERKRSETEERRGREELRGKERKRREGGRQEGRQILSPLV